MGKVESSHHNTTLITADRKVGLFLIHFSKNMVVLSKSISWYLVLTSSALFPACCFQLCLCYWYNSVSTTPPGWRPQVFLLCILLRWFLHSREKMGFISKGSTVKICSLVATGNRSWWRLTPVGQKTVVLYISKTFSTNCTVLESGSLATL